MRTKKNTQAGPVLIFSDLHTSQWYWVEADGLTAYSDEGAARAAAAEAQGVGPEEVLLESDPAPITEASRG